MSDEEKEEAARVAVGEEDVDARLDEDVDEDARLDEDVNEEARLDVEEEEEEEEEEKEEEDEDEDEDVDEDEDDARARALSMARTLLKGDRDEEEVVAMAVAMAESEARRREPHDEDQAALRLLLHYCAQSGRSKALALLDQQPGLLNLHLAMGKGHHKGVTALMEACTFENFDLIHELLKRGANIHARDFFGRTALILAALNDNLLLCELLLLRGADLMAVDFFGRNAVDNCGLYLRLTSARIEAGRQRLRAASANAKVQQILSQLLEHCLFLRRAEALALLDQQPTLLNLHWVGDKFCVNKRWAYKGTTALIAATKGGDLDLVRELLKRGAYLHARDALDWTALFGAAFHAQTPEVCELLLLRGADLTVPNGASALALYGSQSRLTPAEREAGRQRLNELAEIGAEIQDALKLLLEHCTSARRAEALALLDQQPTLLNLRWVGGWFEINEARAWQNTTALIMAANGGDLALVRELLERGADLHMRDSDNWNALMAASCFAHPDVCEFLLLRGADLMAVDKGWKVSLTMAKDDGKNALERYGFNSNLTDAEKEADRQRLFEVWASGPHPSQVQRRRDERWARRWPFVFVLVCFDFQPTAARKAVLALLHPPLPPDAVIPRLPCATLAERRALLRDKIFTHPGLWKLVASYL